MEALDLDHLWDFGDPAGSEARFRDYVGSTEDPRDKAEGMTQLARSLGLQKRFDEADRALDSARSLVAAGSGRLDVRIALERGRVLNSSGKPLEAVPHFESAWRLARQSGEAGLEVDAVHMLAIADSDNALSWNLKGIEMASASDDARAKRWLASLYNNTAWTYLEAGDAPTALRYFEDAVPLREAMGQSEPLKFARWSVGFALRALGRTSEALAVQEKLKAEHDGDATIDKELALCLEDLGRHEEAAPFATAAYSALKDDEWMLENRADELRRLKALSGG